MSTSGRETISLAGTWAFALDPGNAGIRERWFARALNDRITLPGTTDEAGKGELTDERCEDRLSRLYRWIGPAWYQTRVTIPDAWADRKLFLFLERTKDSQVWVDDAWAGSDDSLSTPHLFDLTRQLTPGEHTITLLIDNAKLPPVGPCHQVDERTQTNWNGVVGRIELRVCERVWVRDLQAYPDPDRRCIELVAEVVNELRWSGKAGFTFGAEVVRRESEFIIPPVESGALLGHGVQTVKATLPIPVGVPCWDEFSPATLRVTMAVEAMPVAAWVRDRVSITCGLRSFGSRRGRLVVNGRPTFLRGKNDCALFPLTGYAPMDKASWLRHLGVAASYGINHFRFHSWCPPRAAFEAADELGIYLQVELPNKRGITHAHNRHYTPPAEAYETLDELRGDAGEPATRTAYLTREGERILRAFGNHPSFVMMTLGNEIGGDEAVMKAMCDRFRSLDRRHLYAMGTNHFHWDVRQRDGDDFWVIKGTIPGKPIRGASWECRGHIDHDSPSTTKDYEESTRGVSVPVLAHEVAQYEVYPDYSELPKYAGVLRARNLEIARARLEQAGMLDQAADFCRASGALSVVCRKEEVEAQLRTAGMAGFQLLDIQDFSGQGTALVGILDVFMDSKGLIAPERWREFCCETVPLLWMKKFTWTSDEVFRARVRVAHCGPADLPSQPVTWTLRDGEHVLHEGDVDVDVIPTGSVSEVGLICAPLHTIAAPRQLTLELALLGTPYRNQYDLWVYPQAIDTAAPEGVTVARTWTPQVERTLAAGGRVLLLPEPGALRHSVAMAFQTGFWSPMFRMKGRVPPTGEETPGTQGILCDPAHPLFAHFPTQFHANWQWWRLVKASRALILDDTPRALRPLVQVIDGIDRNHKLGLLFEARVGAGSVLVCTIDLPALQEHPEARQFHAAVHHYIASDSFCPALALESATLRELLSP